MTEDQTRDEMSLTLQVAGKSDVGCVRTNNEDNFGFDMRHGIYVVCDGMGGQAAGEVASKMAVDTVLTYFREGDKVGMYAPVGTQAEGVSDRARALGSAIQLANEAIYEASQAHAAQAGMGSTIVAVKTEKNFFSIGHVGDSRIYMIRAGEIQQLTNDHSLVMEQVRRGLMTREEAETSDMQNIIIRALGTEAQVQPDLDDMVFMPGDILLLGSDGLTKHVNDPKMLEIVQAAPDLDTAVDNLIQAAKDHGGDDNITCLLIKAVEQPWYRAVFSRGNAKWQNSI